MGRRMEGIVHQLLAAGASTEIVRHPASRLARARSPGHPSSSSPTRLRCSAAARMWHGALGVSATCCRRQENDRGDLIVFMATRARCDGIVRLLLAAGTNMNWQVRSQMSYPCARLKSVASLPRVTLSLMRICQSNESDGYTALCCAADSGDARIVHLLLDAGADINLANVCPGPPIACAPRRASFRKVLLFLKAGEGGLWPFLLLFLCRPPAFCAVCSPVAVFTRTYGSARHRCLFRRTMVRRRSSSLGERDTWAAPKSWRR